jgi:hypothetical protein
MARFLRYGCLALGVLLVILGLSFDIHFLLTLGALAFLTGIILFLI